MNGPVAGDESSGVVRVLIVDDSDHFVRAARRALTLEADIQVVGTAASADEAVDAVRNLKPDVVLMDMSMPGANGLEATRAVKAIDPAPGVIILTAHETESYEAAAYRAGADGVVGKWLLQEQALEAIRRLGPLAPRNAGYPAED